MINLNKQDNPNGRQKIYLSEITEANPQVDEVDAWARSETDISKLDRERNKVLRGMIELERPEIGKFLGSFLSIAARRISRQLMEETSNSDVQSFTFVTERRVAAPVIEKKNTAQPEEEAFETLELEELTTTEALSAELKSIDPSSSDSPERVNDFKEFMNKEGHWSVTANGAIRIPKKGNSEEVSAEQSKVFREAWKPLKKEVNVAEGQRAEELAKQEAQRAERLAREKAQRAERLAKQEAQRAEELAKQEAQRNQEIENGIRKVLQVLAVVGVYPRKEVRAEAEVRFETSAKGKEVVRIVTASGDEIKGIVEGRVYPDRFDGMPVALREVLYPEEAQKRDEERKRAA